MSSSHQFTMFLQGLGENYHEVCDSYLLYYAISAIVSGKGVIFAIIISPRNNFFLDL